MAIEKVLIANNTSVIQDEVLAHRLGLIPTKADPRFLNMQKIIRQVKRAPLFLSSMFSVNEVGNVFQDSKTGSSSKPKTYTSFTCSRDSLPEFSGNPIGPTHGDIVIGRLAPGQGIGKTHAKWPAVSPVWYRMLPEVVRLEDIEDQLAEKLVAICPVKVFDIEDIGKGKKRATIARPRACTLCRECIREGKGWENAISLRRKKDHFICNYY